MALPTDVDYSDKNVRVFTRGLSKTVKALEAAGVDAQDMKAVFRKAGNLAERETQHLAPKRSRKLVSSVRMSVLKNKASIKIGKASVPYAARIEFGVVLNAQGRRAYEDVKVGKKRVRVQTSEIAHKIPGHFFMREAIRRTRHKALVTIKDGLTELFHKHNLGEPPIQITGYIVKSNSKAYSTDSKYLS